MADIELIIKISEEMYKTACNYPERVLAGYPQCIKNGIPLPKGHGRLIDADVLENTWHEEFLNGMSISAGMVNTFNETPTIIETDRE